MHKIIKITLLFAITSIFLSASTQTTNDVILWMEKQNDKVIYKSESKVIPESELLDFFASINDKYGTEPTIFVLFQENIGIREVEDIDGAIGKVADFKVRFFIFGKDTDRTKEIIFAQGLVPISRFKR